MSAFPPTDPFGSGNSSKGSRPVEPIPTQVGQPLHPPSKDASLEVEVTASGKARGRRVFDIPEVRVGRHARNDIVFDGPDGRIVSGTHLLFERRDGAWWVEDLRSTNGSLINGQPLDGPSPIGVGDVIELGRRKQPSQPTPARIRIWGIGDAPANEAMDHDLTMDVTIVGGDEMTVGTDDDESDAAETADPIGSQPTIGFDEEVMTLTGAPLDGAAAATSDGETPGTHLEPLPEVPDETMSPPSIDAAQGSPPPVEPAPVPPKDLLAFVQERSQRLGVVQYRLDQLVSQVAEGCLRLGSDVDVDSLPGGSELLESRAQRDEYAQDIRDLEKRLPELEERAKTELDPLEFRLSAARSASDSARESLEAARRKRAWCSAAPARSLRT